MMEIVAGHSVFAVLILAWLVLSYFRLRIHAREKEKAAKAEKRNNFYNEVTW